MMQYRQYKARRRLYTPQLPNDVIHRLYLAARALGRPMTRVAAEAVDRYLNELELAPENGDVFVLTPSGEAAMRARREDRKAA